MPATYEPIATTTLGSAATSITFSSIGSGYTDLRVVLSVSSTSGNSEGVRIIFNNDSSALYSQTYISGDGSSAVSARATGQNFILLHYSGTSTTIPTFYTVDVFSYAGSTNKTILTTGSEDKNGSGNTTRNVGLYRSTTAINELKLSTASAVTFSSGTTATLYGILKA